MEFDVSGFAPGMEEHEHAFRVHWHGASDSDCATIGHVFFPPHKYGRRGGPGGRGGHSSQESMEDEGMEEAEASRRRRSHHTEGEPGERPGRGEGERAWVIGLSEGLVI